jgi:hypothetical protein
VRKHSLLESNGATLYGGGMNEEKHRSLDPEFAFIRKLCSQSSEEELRKANAAFMDYLSVCLRIFERLEQEEQHRSSSLTKRMPRYDRIDRFRSPRADPLFLLSP